MKETLRFEGSAVRNLITNEISILREQQRLLKEQGRIGVITIVILFFCIGVNIISYLVISDYFAFFIAASFYLYMVYFITLLVPMSGGTFRSPRDQIQQFFITLYNNGIILTTDRVTRIFLDAFFVNSRALCSGFILIFSLDVIYAMAGYFSGMFEPATLIIILFQALAILLFYFFLWWFEPGSTEFLQDIRGIKGVFTGRWYPSWVTSLLFGAAALLVLLVIISTIILLPGMTVKTFITLSGLSGIENLFLITGILVTSQYFIVRFFHGISSTGMAAAFSESRIAGLQSAEIEQGTGRSAGGTGTGQQQNLSVAQMRNAFSALLESRIYRLDLQTLWGAFPVYLINPDLSVMFDEKVISAITGYLKGAGSACK